jgi:ferredoxin-nitrite reductase
LPRKFNIAFDGGGSVASARGHETTSGFAPCEPTAGSASGSVVGGIPDTAAFAGDLSAWAIDPEQCTAVALAIVRVFIDEGDRTDRKKARLKYVLDRMGLERFLAEVEKRLPTPLERLALADCEPRPALKPGAHVGFHSQKDPRQVYCGVALPVGRMTSTQMRGLADIAERFASGTLRLTVWQNLIISDIAAGVEAAIEAALAAIGLTSRVSMARAGIVACTGNAGCKIRRE